MPFSLQDLFTRRADPLAQTPAETRAGGGARGTDGAADGATNQVPPAQNTKGRVTAGTLNVRDAARTGSVVGKLSKGDSVDILSEAAGWYAITFEGKTAYVSAAHVYKGGGGGGGHRPEAAGVLRDAFDKHQERLPKTERNDVNKGEHAAFKAHWKEHKARYEKVAAKVDLPARLIAALHWRESSGDFSTYLHQGDPLGKPAKNVPKDIPLFTEWEPAAIHALSMRGKLAHKRALKITQETTDMAALLTYAEAYNGLGYTMYHKDVATPYVYAGTNQYSKGKYKSDGKFSKTMKDKQAGAYGMLKDAEG